MVLTCIAESDYNMYIPYYHPRNILLFVSAFPETVNHPSVITGSSVSILVFFSYLIAFPTLVSLHQEQVNNAPYPYPTKKKKKKDHNDSFNPMSSYFPFECSGPDTPGKGNRYVLSFRAILKHLTK